MDTYVLDLKETGLAERIREQGVGGIDAGRVQAFFEQRGLRVDSDSGITVRGDGTVIATLDGDPSKEWQDFANDPMPGEAERDQRILKIREVRDKIKAKKATAKDKDEVLEIVLTTMLQAFGQE